MSNVIEIINVMISKIDSLLSDDEPLKSNLDEGNHQDAKSDKNEGSAHRKANFPKRWLLNALLIILTTFEVVTIVHSQVYIHKDLLRSFLNFYADR